MIKRRTVALLPFEYDERHSVIVIFLLMSAALLLASGAALDYARVANMREGLELGARSASEAAMGALRHGPFSDDQIREIGVSHFDKGVAFARHVGTIETPAIAIDRVAQTVTVDVKGRVAMTVSRLGGIDEVTVPATFTAGTPPNSDVPEF